MTTRLEALNEILAVLKKHKDKNFDRDLIWQVERHIDYEEKIAPFGIPTYETKLFGTWLKLGDNENLGEYGGKTDRFISCEDNGRVAEGWYYQVSFPTGAYVLNSHYPTISFNSMFEELKDFQPDYSDSSNHNLYFGKDKAKQVYEALPNIIERYKKLGFEEVKQKQIEEAEQALAKLKEGYGS